MINDRFDISEATLDEGRMEVRPYMFALEDLDLHIDELRQILTDLGEDPGIGDYMNVWDQWPLTVDNGEFMCKLSLAIPDETIHLDMEARGIYKRAYWRNGVGYIVEARIVFPDFHEDMLPKKGESDG